MTKHPAFLALALAASLSAGAAPFDPAAALTNAVVENGTAWIDGRLLPIEGRAFDDTGDNYYDRLPAGAMESSGGVRHMKHHSAGMQIRFVTDSPTLSFRWETYGHHPKMDHMAATGVAGIDVYRLDAATGKWRYCATGRPAGNKGSAALHWRPGAACLVNLPLYSGVRSFQVGIKEGSTLAAPPPHRSGVEKPVVFYGTSITQGGCASRPGMSFVNIVGRELDVPVVNLGFSGSGKMEFEMADLLAKIDASCYVLDCVWNMDLSLMKANYERLLRRLRELRPGVPVVMAEWCDVGHADRSRDLRDKYMRDLHAKLLAEGWTGLVYLPASALYGDDGEGTVDGVHANDHGMRALADAYGAAVREALGLGKGDRGR